MKILLSFVMTLFLFNARGQTAQPVTLKIENGNIEGTLLVPPSKNPIPVALLIAGSGPTDRNGNNSMMRNNSLKMLADSLYAHGIASLRYDKRGVAASKSARVEESKMRFGLFIHDADGWVKFLKQSKKFSSIIVVGHSQGSLVGMVTAQQKGVSKFISLEGAGEPIDKVIKTQLEEQPTVVIKESNRILDSLAVGKTVDSVPEYLYSLFRPDVQPFLISWIKYNPKEELKKLHIPILIVQGTTDIQVGLKDAENLSQANPDTKLVIIKGMNHILKDAPANRQENIKTYFEPNLPLNAKLVQTVVEFIKN